MDEFQNEALQQGYVRVVGVDEAGRGPLAGPVVAAAVHIPLDLIIEGISDSKALSEKKRAALYATLMEHKDVLVGVGVVNQDRIDEVNILNATFEAMNIAISQIQGVDYALIDGNRIPKECPVPAKAIVKGDSKSPLIGAASIIAKYTRDQITLEYAEKWPEYGFASHKGYPTKAHLEAVKEHGVLPIHRKTFGPIAALLELQH